MWQPSLSVLAAARATRLFIDQNLEYLRRHAKKLEREKELWRGKTPCTYSVFFGRGEIERNRRGLWAVAQSCDVAKHVYLFVRACDASVSSDARH